MEKLLELLTPKIGFWAITGLLIILATTFATEEIRLADSARSLKIERDSLALCIDDRATLRANVAAISGALDDQNSEIKALQTKNQALATQAAAAAKKALDDGKKRKAEASRLGSGPVVMNAWIKELFK